MFAAVITAAWGVFVKPHIAAASILMWGMGDASAALVGIPYGKHKIKTRYAVKSWEGTVAMFTVAFLFGTIVLYFFGGIDAGHAALAAFPAAAGTCPGASAPGLRFPLWLWYRWNTAAFPLDAHTVRHLPGFFSESLPVRIRFPDKVCI